MHWETKNLCDFLFCDVHFIAKVWNRTYSIFKVCLYDLFLKNCFVIGFWVQITNGIILLVNIANVGIILKETLNNVWFHLQM